VRPDQGLPSTIGAIGDRRRDGLRLSFGSCHWLGGWVSIGSRQDRQEKNKAGRDTAGRDHPGAAPGARYPLAPPADQCPDPLFALLLKIGLVALAQGDRFLPQGCEWLDDSRVPVVFHGFQGSGELRLFGPR
jgi:hypothetical protein